MAHSYLTGHTPELKLAFIGPAGAGKTSAVLTMASDLPPPGLRERVAREELALERAAAQAEYVRELAAYQERWERRELEIAEVRRRKRERSENVDFKEAQNNIDNEADFDRYHPRLGLELEDDLDDPLLGLGPEPEPPVFNFDVGNEDGLEGKDFELPEIAHPVKRVSRIDYFGPWSLELRDTSPAPEHRADLLDAIRASQVVVYVMRGGSKEQAEEVRDLWRPLVRRERAKSPPPELYLLVSLGRDPLDGREAGGVLGASLVCGIELGDPGIGFEVFALNAVRAWNSRPGAPRGRESYSRGVLCSIQ